MIKYFGRKTLLIVLCFGLIATALSGFVVVQECKMVPPGGISEGYRGFPIPYYYCSVVGEGSLVHNEVCSRDALNPAVTCLMEKSVFAGIVLIDIVFWSLIILILLYFYKKIKR